MQQRRMIQIIYLIITIIVIAPSLIITLYSYPVQDDFHYAYYAREMMEQGYNILWVALSYTIQYYKTFCGCYTSSFLGYFISGLVNCNVWGVRIFELFSALFFYGMLLLFVYALMYKIMGFQRKKIIPVYCIIVTMFNGAVYYTWHEAFYWFITSVQYLFIASLILCGVSLFIFSLYEENKKKQDILMIGSAVLGFMGSGGTLSIAAFCCVLYLGVFLWSILEHKCDKKKSLWCIGAAVIGAIINGIAPGNYVRAGETKNLTGIIYAIKMSVRYTLERWEYFIDNPIFWILLVLLVGIIFSGTRKKQTYEFALPGVLIFLLIVAVSGIIFPAILGYGYNCYRILMRGNFISDMAIYLFLLIAICYLKGWFDCKYPQIAEKIVNRDSLLIAGFVIAMLIIQGRNDWKQIAFIREYKELQNGDFEKYAEFCTDIYQEIEDSNDDIVEIHIGFVKHNTCLVDPQLYEGYYDYNEEYCNTTIARFYHKKAVCIYYDEEVETGEKN